jgi:hypothetical protein
MNGGSIMKRILPILLISVLIFASFSSAFAEGVTLPSDVKGTKYEDAVSLLMEKELIAGYPDGSFRPYSTINRAEACVIIIKAINPSEEELKGAEDSSFPDLAGFGWASEYINYALEKGVISGYPDGTFKPSGNVNYAEMASMIIRALGYEDEAIKGEWPDNYIFKGEELKIFENIGYSALSPAIRGDVALMVGKVAEDIKKPDDKPSEPGDQADPMNEYSGRAYGILLDIAKVTNEKNNIVDEYEFLLGSKTYYFKTNGKTSPISISALDGHLNSGDIYGLQMRGGVVSSYDTSAGNFAGIGSPTGYEDFTGAWASVKEIKGYVIETNSSYAGRSTFTAHENVSVYVAKMDGAAVTGYEAGNIRDVKAGKDVRLYSVTGNNQGVVEIILVK